MRRERRRWAGRAAPPRPADAEPTMASLRRRCSSAIAAPACAPLRRARSASRAAAASRCARRRVASEASDASGTPTRRAATASSIAIADSTSEPRHERPVREAPRRAVVEEPRQRVAHLAAGHRRRSRRAARRSLPVGRSSSPAVSTAPMVPTGSPRHLVLRRGHVRSRARQRQRRRVAPGADGLERHVAREPVGARDVGRQPPERLRPAVVADHVGAHVELAAARVGLEAHARIVRLAREVARELPEKLGAPPATRATAAPSGPCSRS